MQSIEPVRKRARDTYRKVFDTRKRRIRGLWQRGARHFADRTVGDDLGRNKSQFVPLNGSALDEAQADYARLLAEHPDVKLPSPSDSARTSTRAGPRRNRRCR